MGMNINELDDVDVNTGSRETPDDGDYNVLIEEAVYGPNKKGNGTGYKLKFTMLDGNFAGTNLFSYVNVNNPNATAQSIGRSDLKTLMVLTGVSDSDDIAGKTIRVRVIGEMDDYRKQNGEQTKIVNLRPAMYMSMDGKNAKGEAVSAFVPKSPTAKEQLAQWRSANMGGGQGAASGTGTSSGQTTGGTSGNGDDDSDIPF